MFVSIGIRLIAAAAPCQGAHPRQRLKHWFAPTPSSPLASNGNSIVSSRWCRIADTVGGRLNKTEPLKGPCHLALRWIALKLETLDIDSHLRGPPTYPPEHFEVLGRRVAVVVSKYSVRNDRDPKPFAGAEERKGSVVGNRKELPPFYERNIPPAARASPWQRAECPMELMKNAESGEMTDHQPSAHSSAARSSARPTR